MTAVETELELPVLPP
jgi:hypothetical protein